MYPTDTDDPIMGAWQAAFPTLFTPVERMPADVREHLRYPRELFDVQCEDLGELPHQGRRRFLYQGRRVEAAGRGLRADPEARQPAQRPAAGRQAPKLHPDYVLARLPGQRGEQFMLTTMFTPYSEENLSGYLTGTVDALGRPSLTQLSLPRSRRVLGPSQVTRQILASPGVSGSLRLLNQETTDLGDRSSTSSRSATRGSYRSATPSSTSRRSTSALADQAPPGCASWPCSSTGGWDTARAWTTRCAAREQILSLRRGGARCRARSDRASVGIAHRSDAKTSTASAR